MKAREWFRKETWSPDDAADFERRLARARGQRTQYLKLQAWHLAGTKKPSLAVPAIELAKRYLQEDPGGLFEGEAHLIIAEANATLGESESALQAYRAAVEVESTKQSMRHCAYLHYAWYAATNGMSDEFANVLKAMEQMDKADLIFPINQYKYFGSLAMISEAFGDLENARRMARNALEAEVKDGPFSRHKDAGIVRHIDASVQMRLRRVAA
jgi:tetratricopeptide (TPR) repeat protein